MSKGQLGILNVGAGDTKLTFDKDNPMDRARSARIVTDMLRRGYVLFIETGVADGKPTYQRVLEFREDVCEYIIADLSTSASPQPVEEETTDDEPIRETPTGEGSAKVGTAPVARATIPKAARGGRPRKSVDASEARGVAVARSAGG